MKVQGGSGCFKATPESACKEVSSGATLPFQSSLVSGKEGILLELADHSTVQLSEGTEVKFLPRTKLQLGKGDTSAEVLQIHHGKLSVSLASSSGALLVKGPNQNAAVIKKGNGIVKVTEDSFVLAMLQGNGVLGSGSEYNDVHEGHVRVLRKKEKPIYRELMHAPEARLEPTIALRVGASPGGARLTWGELPGASAYEVEVRPVKGVGLLKRLPKGTSELSLDSLDGGDYEVGVRAVDSEDFESPWSELRKLSIISIELPPGASMHGNAAQLPDKGKLKLRASPTIEASFDLLTTFVPVPSEVGLAQGKAQTLRLRRRGETQEVQLRLVPRSYQAVVRLSPSNPRWPRDPVQIDIELVSGNGLPAPSDVEMVPRVTLDQEVLSPSWSRADTHLRAVVAPRGDKKPHVLRVEVADQYGFFLGRNFLEVAVDSR